MKARSHRVNNWGKTNETNTGCEFNTNYFQTVPIIIVNVAVIASAITSQVKGISF